MGGEKSSTVLREAFAEITPGYHEQATLGHRAIGRQDRPAAGGDLVTEAYLLVVKKNLPRSLRPVNPATFGARVRRPAAPRLKP